jgi:small conductance mechanosensitive channel
MFSKKTHCVALPITVIECRSSLRLKRVIGIIGIALLLCASLPGLAQPKDSSSSTGVQEVVQRLDRDIAAIKALNVQLASVPEADRESVMFRRDERGISVLKTLNQVTRSAVELPKDDPLRQELTTRLRDDMVAVTDFMSRWVVELGQRIARFSDELESASGTRGLTLQAYIDSLESLRIQSFQAMGDVVEAAASLGLPDAGLRPALQEQLSLYAEILAGRLQFSGAAMEGLQTRLDADSTNTEVANAEASFAVAHAQDLERLDTISTLMGRLGMDNTGYKELLLQQGQELSVTDFDMVLVMQHLRSGWVGLQATLADRAPDMVFNLGIFIVVLLVFRMLSRMTRRLVAAACQRSRLRMSTLLESMLVTVSAAAVMAVGIMIALSMVGISLGPMLAGLGVAGFIVGFALQDTLGNFAAGGMILLYRPYDVDDVIEVAGVSGKVKKMSLVSTMITTFDNQTLVVPNSKIWGDVIKNVTAQRTRRVDLQFGIGYDDDIDKAERVLQDIIAKHDMVLETPEPTIKLHTLGDSSVNFIVRPWVKTEEYWDVYWDVTREVKKRFDEEGISIPFPQRDVHIYQESESDSSDK